MDFKFAWAKARPLHFSLLILLTFSFSLFKPVYAEEDIPLEGIVYEPRNPSQSFASIDGDFYKKGSHYHDYEIIEVKQNRILVKNSSGIIQEYDIKGKPASPAAVAPSPLPVKQPENLSTSSASEEARIVPPQENTLDQLKKSMGSFNPLAILNNAAELGVAMELRKLQMQAAASESPGSLDKMIAEGLVDPSLKENKRGFVYRLESTGKGVQGYADPVKNPDSSKHFMIDAWGNIRVEQGKPATSESPLYEMLPQGAAS